MTPVLSQGTTSTAKVQKTSRIAIADLLSRSSPPARMRWPLQDLFADLRVRSGIKFGLAALLALYIAEVLRLEHPNWAILTVLGVMSVPYVGSISILAITQVAGTIAGALVGIWLVGDYASNPVIFLTLFFFVLAFAAYKFGQAPTSQVSMGYYLVGFTTIAVATFGLTDPAQVWQAGVSRVLEILDGVLSSLLVTSLLWPRYAGDEFAEAGRAALKTLSDLFSLHMNANLRRQKAEAEQTHRAFEERLTVLRNLLQVASRENIVFEVRYSNQGAFLASLTHLFHLILDLSRAELETSILSRIEPELVTLASAISEEFDILAASPGPDQKLGSSRFHEAFAAFEEKLSALRKQDAFNTTQACRAVAGGGGTCRAVACGGGLQRVLPFYRGFAVLRSLRDELNNIRSLTEGLPRLGQPATEPKLIFGSLPTIDWFWVKMGVKGALAVVISILLLMWINPPGGTVIPLVAWLLTILRRPFLRAGGTGDLRTFQNGFLAALALAGCVVVLILVTPLLADYSAMNLALFLMMFAVGFVTARSPGINFWTQIGMLTIYSFVGLNPQQPVATGTIIDTFVGFITGIAIATVVGRLFWPVLPQMVMRDNLLAVFREIKVLLERGRHEEKIQNQLAILPAEALKASRQIRIAGCTAQEKARLGAFVRALQTVVTRSTVLVSGRQTLPGIGQAVLRSRFEWLEAEFQRMLDAFAECFRRGDCRREIASLNSALSEIEEPPETVPENEITEGLEPSTSSTRVFEVADHYHATAEALEECRRLIGTLKIHRYWGHCGL